MSNLSDVLTANSICVYVTQDSTRSSVVAVTADRTAYALCGITTDLVWNSRGRGQRKYSVTYSFELKSAFSLRQLFLRLWLNDTSYSKSV